MTKRCFIAANGPGLNNIDVSKLTGETVFGLNRGYLKKDLPLTYLVVVNPLVEIQFGKEILSQDVKQIFANSLLGKNVTRLRWTPDVPSFQPDITKPMWQGHTVTYVALQIAYSMGFDTVYLIGLDHYFDYSNAESSGGVLKTVGEDPNHFSPEYFGNGVKWEKANLVKSAEAYRLADKFYKDHGRKIYNASDPTRCTAFERVEFNSIFK